MSNGFISSLAAMRSAQGAGSQMGLFNLFKKATDDYRILDRQEDEYKEEYRKSKKEASDREDKRGKDRLKGGLLGAAGIAAITALTGGTVTPLILALGAGGGSYAGQRMGQGGVSLQTPLGRKPTLRKIARGTNDIFFHSGTQRKIEGMRNDINDFLTEADKRFDQSITTSALGDAYLAYKAGSLDLKGFGKNIKNLKNLPSLVKGDISWEQYKELLEGGAKLPSPKGVGMRGKLGFGGFDKIRSEGIKKMDFNKKFYGQGFPDYFSRLLLSDKDKFGMQNEKSFNVEDLLKLINKNGGQ
jgi:hypothetical protein|tara:strand:- start:443 stop:1342 length:900 start_codon:yes stop_codon:yes gene_type:complete